MRYQYGYVLFIVLIFLQVFSLLGWYSLSASKLMMTSNRDMQLRYGQKDLAIQEITEIENKIQGNEFCLITNLPVSQLLKRPIRWWKNYACQTRDGHYFYVIESLGPHPCALIQVSDKHFIHAKFYRITLRKRSDTIRFDSNLLQSTVALKTNEIVNCPLSTYQIKAGVQTRREI